MRAYVENSVSKRKAHGYENRNLNPLLEMPSGPLPTCERLAILAYNYAIERGLKQRKAFAMIEAGLEDDVASAFSMKVRELARCKNFEGKGRDLHFLSSCWKFFSREENERLREESDRLLGIRDENELRSSRSMRDSGKFISPEEATVLQGLGNGRLRRSGKSVELANSDPLAESLLLENRVTELTGLTREIVETALALTREIDRTPTQREIGAVLKISERTVRYHLKAVREQGRKKPHSGKIIRMQASAEHFLTPKEAAAYLGGLNDRTLVRWARENYIPAIPLGEGKRRLWRFLESDLEAWMLARRQGGQIAA